MFDVAEEGGERTRAGRPAVRASSFRRFEGVCDADKNFSTD
jgi:hypothetical protein